MQALWADAVNGAECKAVSGVPWGRPPLGMPVTAAAGSAVARLPLRAAHDARPPAQAVNRHTEEGMRYEGVYDACRRMWQVRGSRAALLLLAPGRVRAQMFACAWHGRSIPDAPPLRGRGPAFSATALPQRPCLPYLTRPPLPPAVIVAPPQTEGLAGFYRGMRVKLAQTVLAAALMMMLKEVRHWGVWELGV